jgi:formate hydrogenlyase subunit 6/NADH:ubiquinone oxidoreductase subunit I
MSSSTVKRLITPRPYIVHERCTRCGTCVQVCPVDPKAVDWRGGDRSVPPVHEYERCIRCYCCQEMCPERAIEVKTPPLGRIIRR